jgi:hypothetical protein
MAPEFAKAASQAAGEAIFVKVNTDEQTRSRPVSDSGDPCVCVDSEWASGSGDEWVSAGGAAVGMDAAELRVVWAWSVFQNGSTQFSGSGVER